jgi:hypothetical protein
MPDHVIEFHRPPAAPASLPAPFPATQAVPDWLKQMPTDHPGGPGGQDWMTLKRCPPFLDALTAGYLMPLAADVRFAMSAAGGLQFQCDVPVVQTHVAQQFPGAPFAGRTVIKFMSAWVVKTPPGFSCLFVQPLNRFDLPFHVLAGVVETDTYYREVNFPAVCLLQPGQSVVLKQGTPIAQLIPFRRETWEGRPGATDIDRRKAVSEAFKTPHLYKDEHWRRKGHE